MFLKQFVEVVKKVRKENKLTQSQIGDKSFISDLECGRLNNITTNTINSICECLGIRLELKVVYL